RAVVNRARLLRDGLGDFPLPAVEFAPTGQLRPGKDGGLEGIIRCSINPAAYRKYVARLEQALQKVAVRSGEITFRLRWSDTNLYYPEAPLPQPDAAALDRVTRNVKDLPGRLRSGFKTVRQLARRAGTLRRAGARVVPVWRR